MAEFEDEEAAGFELRGRLRDEAGVEFVAFFAAEESEYGFVVTNFAGKGRSLAEADVGGVGDDEVEKQ